MTDNQGAETLYIHSSYNEAEAFMYEACLYIAHKKALIFVYDKTDKSPRLIRAYPCGIEKLEKAEILDLNQTLNSIPETDMKVSRFSVLVMHERHSLVPEVFFDKAHAALLYKHNNEHGDMEDLLHQRLPAFHAVMIFPFHRYLVSLLNARLKSPLFIHQSATLLYGMKQYVADPDALLLYYTPDFSSIVYRKDKSLKFINSFKAETENDALYFLLAAMEEFSLPPSTPVWLCGELEEDHTIISLFRKYLADVRLLKNDSLPGEQKLFSLLSAALCES